MFTSFLLALEVLFLCAVASIGLKIISNLQNKNQNHENFLKNDRPFRNHSLPDLGDDTPHFLRHIENGTAGKRPCIHDFKGRLLATGLWGGLSRKVQADGSHWRVRRVGEGWERGEA